MKWNDFRTRRNVGASSRRTDAFGGAPASSGPTDENDCRPRAGATGNAVFPTTVSAERLGWQPHSPNDETDRRKAGDMATEKLMDLVRVYETLTPDMETELGFTQLTLRAPAREVFHDRISRRGPQPAYAIV
jgi:hypothetical protein